MAYSLLYHPDVRKKDLPKIPKNIQGTIQRAIEERLLPDPLLHGEPLRRDLKGYRKFRVGDYRIIYQIEKDQIAILKIGHRREVYEKVFPRL